MHLGPNADDLKPTHVKCDTCNYRAPIFLWTGSRGSDGVYRMHSPEGFLNEWEVEHFLATGCGGHIEDAPLSEFDIALAQAKAALEMIGRTDLRFDGDRVVDKYGNEVSTIPLKSLVPRAPKPTKAPGPGMKVLR